MDDIYEHNSPILVKQEPRVTDPGIKQNEWRFFFFLQLHNAILKSLCFILC